MGIFGERFPYTNFHDLNLDWILMTLKEISERIDELQFTVADPIQWDITKSYDKNTFVMDGNTGYISKQPVSAGTDISNTEYWQEIFDISELLDDIKHAITTNDDGTRSTSSVNRELNDLVWLNDKLYKVIEPISSGSEYTSTNIEETSIEEWINTIENALITTISIVDGRVTALETQTNTKIAEVKNIFKRNRKSVILIGDSYGLETEWWTGWLKEFRNQYEDVITIHGEAVGGSGFIAGGGIQNFTQTLTDVLATMTTEEKENVTDVIAIGGYNDMSRSATINQLKTNMESFKTTALNACPYAKISVGFCAVHYGNYSTMQSLRQMKANYENASAYCNISFITRLNMVLLNKSLIFIADGNPNSNFHPNNDGCVTLAYRIAQYISTGVISDIDYGEFYKRLIIYVENGQVHVHPTNPPFFAFESDTQFPITVEPNGWVDVVDLADSNLLWCFDSNANGVPHFTVFMIKSGSTIDDSPILLQGRLYNNKLQVGNLLFNANVTIASDDAITIPCFSTTYNEIY